MIFSAEQITLSSRDEEVIGLAGQATFRWQEFNVLHRLVAEAFAEEFECEATYFDVLRTACDDTEIAFGSSALSNFKTYRLGQMLVSLDKRAEAQ